MVPAEMHRTTPHRPLKCIGSALSWCYSLALTLNLAVRARIEMRQLFPSAASNMLEELMERRKPSISEVWVNQALVPLRRRLVMPQTDQYRAAGDKNFV